MAAAGSIAEQWRKRPLPPMTATTIERHKVYGGDGARIHADWGHCAMWAARTRKTHSRSGRSVIEQWLKRPMPHMTARIERCHVATQALHVTHQLQQSSATDCAVICVSKQIDTFAASASTGTATRAL